MPSPSPGSTDGQFGPQPRTGAETLTTPDSSWHSGRPSGATLALGMGGPPDDLPLKAVIHRGPLVSWTFWRSVDEHGSEHRKCGDLPSGRDASGRDASVKDSSFKDAVSVALEPMGRSGRRHPAQAELGRRVRAQRHRLGISQMALAEIVGLHFSFVSEVERGERNLSLSSLLRLADALEVDPGKLVAGLHWTEDGE